MNGRMMSFCCKGRADEVSMMFDLYKELMEDDSSETELIRAGIVPEALGYLRAEQRIQILTGAGLDPALFDF